jgi:hypothetical protein
MHPLMGYLSHPHPQLRAEILRAAGFAPLQPAEEISALSENLTGRPPLSPSEAETLADP